MVVVCQCHKLALDLRCYFSYIHFTVEKYPTDSLCGIQNWSVYDAVQRFIQVPLPCCHMRASVRAGRWCGIPPSCGCGACRGGSIPSTLLHPICSYFWKPLPCQPAPPAVSPFPNPWPQGALQQCRCRRHSSAIGHCVSEQYVVRTACLCQCLTRTAAC